MSNGMDGPGPPERTAPSPHEESPAQSVHQAVGILEFLGSHEEAGATDMAAALGVRRSTASRPAALEVRGPIERTKDRDEHRLGFGPIRPAGAATVRPALSRRSRRVHEQPAVQVAETVNPPIVDGNAAIDIGPALGPSVLTTHDRPSRCTQRPAAGSRRAHLPDLELAGGRAEPLESHTPSTVTAPGPLRAQPKRARTDACAHSVEEPEKGLNAVAAPVFTLNGGAMAALGAPGPPFRRAKQRPPEGSAPVRAVAEEIPEGPGHFRRPTP
ncbi:hypothetical protein SUDANB6_05770 [Streptomyces sp. enrichment culture]|uniref:IclR family transcriptional regulator domain-containing protein n=1 Tax=Streptomyces sp. enrichment culture TaxID=1795815 RepID=UPI003F55220F